VKLEIMKVEEEKASTDFLRVIQAQSIIKRATKDCNVREASDEGR